MKKILSGILIVMMVLTMMPTAVFAEENSKEQTIKNEYVLTAASPLTEVKLPCYVKEITFADEYAALIEVERGISLSQVYEDFADAAAEISVQPNYVYEAASVNDPYASLQWGLFGGSGAVRDIGFSEISDFLEAEGDTLTETVVAVLDTGIDYTHEDLSAHIWTNPGEIPGNGRDDDRNGYVDDVRGYDFCGDRNLPEGGFTAAYNHGTHCAGTIAAASGNGIGITGIAGSTDKVSLMDVKVLQGREGTGSTFSLICGIQYAEKNGADICNLSMGSYVDDPSLYRTMAKSDMLFVCAAGNDGIDLGVRPIYPGCYDLANVICVGNTEKSGRLYKLSNFSAVKVDIAAPGTEIYGTLTGNRYGNMSGTSMAVPFVSGTAALLHSYYEDISASEMRNLILDSAVSCPELKGRVAYGRFLDAYKSLTYNRDTFQKDTQAPKLKTSVLKISGSYKQRLFVTAVDDSGGKPRVRYARGEKSLNYFRSGAGYKVALDDSGKGSRIMAVPAVYSVYAVDAAGNDTLMKVRCTADAVSSISLNYSQKTIYKGKSLTLKATLSKKGANGRKLTWSSSNKSVVTVSSTGKVTGKKKGTAVITVKTGNGLCKTCKLTVK